MKHCAIRPDPNYLSENAAASHFHFCYGLILSPICLGGKGSFFLFLCQLSVAGTNTTDHLLPWLQFQQQLQQKDRRPLSACQCEKNVVCGFEPRVRADKVRALFLTKDASNGMTLLNII